MDYHIISGNAKRDMLTVVIDYPVKTGTNAAGVAWTDAVAQTRLHRGETGTSLVPWKDATAIGLLDAGTVVELETTIRDDANKTRADRLAFCDTKVAARADRLYRQQITRILRYYGTTRSV